MAVEKGKVLLKLEEILKGKSASKNFKENIASKWADKIETDEDIETYINDREDILLEASSEADRRATEAAQKAKAPEPKPEPTPKDVEPKPEPKSEMDELKELVKSLSGTVQTMQQQRTQETITERFLKDERLKGIPDFVLKRAIPKSEEDFDTAVTELATEYTEFAKKEKLSSFGNDAPPNANQPKPNELSADMKAYMASKKPAEAAK